MSSGLKLIAVTCALLVTAAVFTGYAYIRKRHAQVLARAQQDMAAQNTSAQNTAKGPPKVHISMDDALLKSGRTIIGGSVKNISGEKLGGLSVELELRRRGGGSPEQRLVALEPPQLESEQEGRYSLTVSSRDYGSVRLVGLRGGPDSQLLAYTSEPGQKRPPERLEPKVIPGQKRSQNEFLNSPENPTRVP
jgi:hypothetical protein